MLQLVCMYLAPSYILADMGTRFQIVRLLASTHLMAQGGVPGVRGSEALSAIFRQELYFCQSKREGPESSKTNKSLHVIFFCNCQSGTSGYLIGPG